MRGCPGVSSRTTQGRLPSFRRGGVGPDHIRPSILLTGFQLTRNSHGQVYMTSAPLQMKRKGSGSLRSRCKRCFCWIHSWILLWKVHYVWPSRESGWGWAGGTGKRAVGWSPLLRVEVGCGRGTRARALQLDILGPLLPVLMVPRFRIGKNNSWEPPGNQKFLQLSFWPEGKNLWFLAESNAEYILVFWRKFFHWSLQNLLLITLSTYTYWTPSKHKVLRI